ncbi:D-glucuronyl C5-epimerase family protein [Dryocola sp. BD613]|uniref:D-glucuronyl C5-epimerase family protein n=1 Tax=Dryocola sp. BD613 TaxID=3133272 RepID=UPI003F4FB43A
MRKKIILSAFIVVIISAASLYAFTKREHWPEHNVSKENMEYGADRVNAYQKSGLDAGPRMTSNYTVKSDYLNYGKTKSYREGERTQIDNQGVPLIKYGNEFQYNPVTISQFVLTEYGRYLAGQPKEKMMHGVDRLLTLQSKDGAFRYNFPYLHYTSVAPYKSGWISGMAQGVALSALARVYLLNQDPRLLEAGNKALMFLKVPKSQGGPLVTMADLDKSLDGYIFFEEYLTTPNVYTLNGYMFTLMGLYDWAEATHSKEAKELFDSGIKTLEKILPYYDLGNFTVYDLSYITHKRPDYLIQAKPHIDIRYHAVHITQLSVLESITKSKVLKKYMEKWQDEVKKS